LPRAAVCGRRCPCAGRCVKYVPKFGGSAPDHLPVVPRPRGFLDAALGFVLLAGERRSAGIMEGPEVGPVIEDAAAGTGEDAPVPELLAVGPTTRNALATIFV